MDNHIEPAGTNRPSADTPQAVEPAATACPADAAARDLDFRQSPAGSVPPPAPPQPAEQTQLDASVDKSCPTPALGASGSDNAATTETLGQPDSLPPTDAVHSDSPPPPAATSSPRKRREAHELTKADLRDTLRRLMVGTAQGTIAKDTVKEIHGSIKLYADLMDEDARNTKERAPIDVSELRRRAEQDPNILDFIEPLLSDAEINETINGSQPKSG